MKRLLYIIAFSSVPFVGICQSWFWASGQITDSNALEFLDAVAPGDTVRSGQAINTFVKELKDSGLWNNYKALYPLYGGTPDAIRFNMKDPRPLGAAYYLTLHGRYDCRRGFQSLHSGMMDSLSGYANTHLIPSSSLNRTNKHFSIRSNTVDKNKWFDLCTRTFSNSYDGLINYYSTGNKYYLYISSTSTGYINTFSGYTYGNFAVSRGNATQVNYYLNGSSVGINPKASNATANQSDSAYILSWGSGMTDNMSSMRNYTVMAIGDSLTSEQVADESDIFENLDRDLNRTISNDFYDLVYPWGGYNHGVFSCQPTFKSITSPDSIMVGITMRGQVMVSRRGNFLYKSYDQGQTYVVSPLYFSNADSINFGFIFNNGRFIFTTTRNKVYYVDSSFTLITETALYHQDGSPYVYHTPANYANPGSYFDVLGYCAHSVLNNREIMVYGNYTNTSYGHGASPVNIYFSSDSGKTLKTCWEGGINTFWKDDGTVSGGPTGADLGNPLNPLHPRHFHGVTYVPIDTSWIAYTGDGGVGGETECMWLRGIYDYAADTFTWSKIIQGNSHNRYKTGGLVIVGDSLMFSSDVTDSVKEMGVYMIAYSDILDSSKCRKVLNTTDPLAYMVIDSNIILISVAGTGYDRSLRASNNNGSTFNDHYFMNASNVFAASSGISSDRILYRTFSTKLYPSLGSYLIKIR